MKFKLPIGVCVLISLALVVFGLLFGTMSGYADDRAQVEALLSGENGVLAVLSYRGADGMNLCAVASRHLPESDADVAALRAAGRALMDEHGSLAAKREGDAALTDAVNAVAAKLKACDSFQQSERDRKYLDMLQADLQKLEASAVTDTYDRAAEEFNAQLDQKALGALARWLGVKPCERFVPGGESDAE